MPSYAADRPWPGASNWSNQLSRDALHALARGSFRMAGFQTCVINVIHRDCFRVVAVAGDDATRNALMDSEVESKILLFELTRADRWGERFWFVPAERAGRGRAFGWTTDRAKRPEANAWDQEDLLLAPLLYGDGEMIGMLSVNAALDGLRPGPEAHDALDAYAEQIELALRVALDRDEVGERARLGGVVRSIVRAATGAVNVPDVWRTCHKPLLRGFAAREIWVHHLSGEESLSEDHPLGRCLALRAASRETAEKMWTDQQVHTRGLGKPSPEYAGHEHCEKTLEARVAHDSDRLLVVPLGSSEECVALLTLVRGRTDPSWSATEQRMARRLGKDLGHAILTSWATEQREQLLTMLREANESRENVVATLTHELKSPITVLRAHLETLEKPDSAQMPHALPAMGRAVSRLTSMVDDLLLLTRLWTTTPAARTPVDLTEVAAQTIAEYSDVVAVSGLQMRLDAVEEDPDSWWAVANPDDLRMALSNLVSNAIKYTPSGGKVVLRVGRENDDEVVVECSDDGIGIDDGDLDELFDEFVRSDDPRARAPPSRNASEVLVHAPVVDPGWRTAT